MDGKGLITLGTLSDVGDAIREQLDTETEYLPSEMPAAIRSIQGKVTSVNGQTGAVELDAADVGALSPEDVDAALSNTSANPVQNKAIKAAMDGKAPVIIDTATGNPATFSDGADGLPVQSLVVAIEPVQEGVGDPSPENIRPISGWTGLTINHSGADTSDPEQVAVSWADETGTVYGGSLDLSTGVLIVTMYGHVFDGTETVEAVGSGSSRFIRYYTGVKVTTGSSRKCSHLARAIVTTSDTTEGFYAYSVGGTAGAFQFRCPSAFTTAAAFNEWCAEQYAAGTPLTAIAVRTNAITRAIDPVQIYTLFGANSFWADTGNVSVEYPADTKLYVDKKIAELQALVLENQGG